MGRPLAFDKDEVMDQAMELFWMKGYEATSLKDLLHAMNLSKSSFYQSFKSKNQLFNHTIVRYRRRLTTEMRAKLEAAPTGRHFIESMFNEFMDSTGNLDRHRGCFVMNCASEFAQRDADVSELVLGGLNEFEAIFKQAVERAIREGDIANGKNPQTIASYLVSSRSGLKTMAKAGTESRVLANIVHTVYSTLGW